MGVDAEPKYAQPVVEIVFPDRPVPRRGRTLEDLGAPDVVDQDVDGAVLAAETVSQRLNLFDVEMVDLDGDAGAAELSDQFG